MSAGRWGLPLPQRLLAFLRTLAASATREIYFGTQILPGLPVPSMARNDEFDLLWDQGVNPRARVLSGHGKRDGEPYTWRNLCAFSEGPYGVESINYRSFLINNRLI